MADLKPIDDLYEEVTYDLSKPFADMARNGFIKKVYGILSAQLFVTVLVVMAALQFQGFGEFILNNYWLTLVCSVATLVIIVVLAASEDLAKRVPWNYALLSAFTLCESYCVAGLCMFYEPTSVAMAALMTLSVTLALTAYACMTKEDFTIKMGTAVNLCVVLLLLTILSMFIHDRSMELVVSAFGVFCYGMFIIIDT